MSNTNNGAAVNCVLEAFQARHRVVLPTETGIGADTRRPALTNHIGDRPRPLPEIVDETVQLLRGWPKVVDGSLLATTGPEELRQLTTPSHLFAYISGEVDVLWKNGVGFPTKEEYFARMIQQCEQYASVEQYPHHRPTPNSLYFHRALPPVRPGTLDQLLSHFSPASPEDAYLLRAYTCTLFWGGSAGSRPVFVFTNNSRDRGDRGRGIGKSKVISELSELCGGLIDVDSNTDIGKLETRLLSAGARDKRLVRIDNVKTEKLSSAGFERLITAPVISGHRMYAGEGTRPNYLTFAMTMNGVSVSEDLASRAVVIELSRPSEYRPTWQDDVRQFIELHRWEIIAEIISILTAPVPTSLQGFQRQAEWEAGVLARQPDAQRVLHLLQTRRNEIDGDAETVQAILDQLWRQYGGSGRTTNRVELSTMIDLVHGATDVRKAKNQIKKFLDRLRVPGLEHQHDRNGAFYLWNNPVAVTPPALQHYR